MWRHEIKWCLEAEEASDELAWSQMLADKGCGRNQMGDVCGDGALATLKAAGCPADQAEVDTWVDDLGCCVASYAQLSMAQAELTDAPACPGEFTIGKPCKVPKWKLPKNPPKAASLGKGKKAAIGAGAVIGGLAGLALIGAALRRRKQRATAKPRQTADVAMTPAVVAV